MKRRIRRHAAPPAAARRAGTVAALAVAGVVATAGGALAYYATGIDGTDVTVSTASGTVVLEAVAAPSAPLWPGGPAADVVVTVTNPFPVPVRVDRVTATAEGCSSPDLQVTQPAQLPLTVPAGGTATATLDDVVRLGTGASDDCQGAVLTVRYTVTGEL